MGLQLFSIDQAPSSVPVWEAILEDLGRPPADRVARVLQVGRSTVYRWNAARHAPRMAQLALFWLTRWGRSQVSTQATNDAILAAQLARALTEERDELRAQLYQLQTSRSHPGPAPDGGLSWPQLHREPAHDWPPIVPPAPMTLPVFSAPRDSCLSRDKPTEPPAIAGARSPTAAFMAREHHHGAPASARAGWRDEHAAPAVLRGLSDPRPGTPASAPLASRRSHGGYRPHPPAWSEPAAPPGQPSSDALSLDAPSHPTRTTK